MPSAKLTDTVRAFFKTKAGRNVGHFLAAFVGAFIPAVMFAGKPITIDVLLSLVPGVAAVAFRTVFPGVDMQAVEVVLSDFRKAFENRLPIPMPPGPVPVPVPPPVIPVSPTPPTPAPVPVPVPVPAPEPTPDPAPAPAPVPAPAPDLSPQAVPPSALIPTPTPSPDPSPPTP